MQNFWRKKIYTKKRVNYTVNCQFFVNYTVNCQFFALNLKKFTPAKKIYTSAARGARDKYEVWSILSDELINDFEQEYQFVICQGLRFKVEQDWPLLSVISKM